MFITTNHKQRKISPYSLLKAVNWVLMEQVKFIDLQKNGSTQQPTSHMILQYITQYIPILN